MKLLRTWILVVPLYVLSLALLVPAFGIAIVSRRLQRLADVIEGDA